MESSIQLICVSYSSARRRQSTDKIRVQTGYKNAHGNNYSRYKQKAAFSQELQIASAI